MLFAVKLPILTSWTTGWGESAEDDRKDLERPGILQENRLERLPRHLRAEWTRAPSKVDPDVGRDRFVPRFATCQLNVTRADPLC